jgi:hypothetical protein
MIPVKNAEKTCMVVRGIPTTIMVHIPFLALSSALKTPGIHEPGISSARLTQNGGILARFGGLTPLEVPDEM